MWYCWGKHANSKDGHWVEGEPDFCPEHDNRIVHILGRLAVYTLLLFIFILLVTGIYTECTTTDPDYWYYR